MINFDQIINKALKRGNEREEEIRLALSYCDQKALLHAGFNQASLERLYLACNNAKHFSKIWPLFTAKDSWKTFTSKVDLMGGVLEEWLDCMSLLLYEPTLKEKTLENMTGYLSCCQEYKNTHSLDLSLAKIMKSFA